MKLGHTLKKKVSCKYVGELKNPGVVYGTVRAVTKRRVATLQEVNFWDIFQRVK